MQGGYVSRLTADNIMFEQRNDPLNPQERASFGIGTTATLPFYHESIQRFKSQRLPRTNQ
jgi:hypothetical protein